MDIVLDACSIINLFNGGCFDKVLGLNHSFYIGDMLLDQEIVPDFQKVILQALIDKNKIQILPSNLSLAEYLQFKNKYNLGIGETECLALCKNNGYNICTDDKKARECSGVELGQSKVVGSLFLLKESVKAAILNCVEAIDSYKLMRKKGGFLPTNMDQNYFCKE